MDIQINIEEIEGTIGGLLSTLESNQSEITSAYEGLTSSFTESSGDEAEALRALQKAEASMMMEMSTTLVALAKSVQFAAQSFRVLDTSGAKSMY